MTRDEFINRLNDVHGFVLDDIKDILNKKEVFDPPLTKISYLLEVDPKSETGNDFLVSLAYWSQDNIEDQIKLITVYIEESDYENADSAMQKIFDELISFKNQLELYS